MAVNPLRDAVLALLGDQCIRMTPSDLMRHIRRQFPSAGRQSFRSAIKSLVDQGEVFYTNHFNTTHIEFNLNRPRRITDRIVLSPSDSRACGAKDQFVIKLYDGAAFGMGDHPTTRLMLRGIDGVLGHHPGGLAGGCATALDIGTGSGILSLAAARLGISRVMAVDTDPVACVEAEKNVQLNGFEDRIVVLDCVEKIPAAAEFDFIFANLRPPTLLQLFPLMRKWSFDGSMWVLSGFRPQERNSIEKHLNGIACSPIWKDETCGWSAIAVKSARRDLRR